MTAKIIAVDLLENKLAAARKMGATLACAEDAERLLKDARERDIGL